MRHIPEEELHAYLDQALSRSQCIEIETHLAACIRCRHDRDEIAVIRDRTTALLSLVAPEYCSLAPYSRLAVLAGAQTTFHGSQHSTIVSRLRHRRNRLLASSGLRQAAMIALAVGAGWGARSWLTVTIPTPPGVDQVAAAPGGNVLSFSSSGFPLTAKGVAPTLQSTVPLSANQPAAEGRKQLGAATSRRTIPRLSRVVASPTQLAATNNSVNDLALTVKTESVALPTGDFSSGGLWRTISWSEAEALSGDAVPRIAGYPVVEVQVQRLGPEERPLLLVSQQDPVGGEIIRTIEGPVQLVAELLAAEIDRSGGAIRNSSPGRSQPDYVFSESGTPKRSIRVVTVAGRLPADSLNLIARHLTAR